MNTKFFHKKATVFEIALFCKLNGYELEILGSDSFRLVRR